MKTRWIRHKAVLLAAVVSLSGGCDCSGQQLHGKDVVMTDGLRGVRAMAAIRLEQRIQDRQNEEQDDPSDAPEPKRTPKEIMARIQTCNTFMLQKDGARLRGCYARNARAGRAGGASPLIGPSNIVERIYRPAWTAFPKLKGGAEKILLTKNRVAIMAWGHGKHTGNLRGVSASERTLGIRSLRLLQVNPSGVITEDLSYSDTVTVMGQLGLMDGEHRPAFSEVPEDTETILGEGDDIEQRNQDLAIRHMRAWNARDHEALGVLYAEDVVVHDQVYRSDHEGRAEVMEADKALFTAVSNLKVKSKEIWSAGSYVVHTQDWMGTHDGDLPELGLMRTRKAFRIPVASVLRFEEGEIVEVWRYWDLAQLMRQIDLMDKP